MEIKMEEKLIHHLIETAAAQRQYSYAPYSRYRVGAALLVRDGTIFPGCNIENAAYTPSICAERTAFTRAVSEGVRGFDAICIVGGFEEETVPSGYSVPCGVCRQVMMEFCDPQTFRIIAARNTENYKIYLLRDLLPLGFGPENLKMRPRT